MVKMGRQLACLHVHVSDADAMGFLGECWSTELRAASDGWRLAARLIRMSSGRALRRRLQSWRAQGTYKAVGLPCTRVTVVRPAALLRSGHANGPLLKDGSPAVSLISFTLIMGATACVSLGLLLSTNRKSVV